MNKDQYYKALSRDPQWAANNVVQINTKFVLGTDLVKSQIRQGDIITSHVSELVDSIYEKGQRIPITVEIDGTNEKGQTVYRPVDGMHRLEAFQRLQAQFPDRASFTFVEAEVKTFATNSDRALYQIQCNSHDNLPAKSNNEADAARVIDKVANGTLAGLDPELQGKKAEDMNRINPKGYREALVSFVGRTFGWTKKNSEKTVDKFLKKLPGKLKNYTSDAVYREFEAFVSKNIPAGMQVLQEKRRGKDKVNIPNTSVFKLGSTDHVFPNVTGNAYRAKTDEIQNSSVVVIWDKSTIGKDFSDIDRTRKDMIEKINQANSSPLLKRGVKLVDRIFIGPQKLDESNGREPLEKGFLEIKKTSSGKFSTRFPTAGWDTTK